MGYWNKQTESNSSKRLALGSPRRFEAQAKSIFPGLLNPNRTDARNTPPPSSWRLVARVHQSDHRRVQCVKFISTLGQAGPKAGPTGYPHGADRSGRLQQVLQDSAQSVNHSNAIAGLLESSRMSDASPSTLRLNQFRGAA